LLPDRHYLLNLYLCKAWAISWPRLNSIGLDSFFGKCDFIALTPFSLCFSYLHLVHCRYIRASTVVQPHALVLFAAEMAVAPLEPVPQEYVEVDLDDEDAAPIPKPEGGSALFSEPEKPVAVVLDRWLRFQTTAVEAAQLYCLRERLAATFAYKVKRCLLAFRVKPMVRFCFTALSVGLPFAFSIGFTLFCP
jgi:hypothetical protein